MVELEGFWLPDHTVISRQPADAGRPGVITPLQLRGTSAVVLVQRGWVPAIFRTETQVPDVVTPAGDCRSKAGWLPPPSRLYEFSRRGRLPGVFPHPAKSRPGCISLRHATAAAGFVGGSVGEPLKACSATGLSSPRASINTMVTFQWFGLCGLIALLYVWFPNRPTLHSPTPRAFLLKWRQSTPGFDGAYLPEAGGAMDAAQRTRHGRLKMLGCCWSVLHPSLRPLHLLRDSPRGRKELRRVD